MDDREEAGATVRTSLQFQVAAFAVAAAAFLTAMFLVSRRKSIADEAFASGAPPSPSLKVHSSAEAHGDFVESTNENGCGEQAFRLPVDSRKIGFGHTCGGEGGGIKRSTPIKKR